MELNIDLIQYRKKSTFNLVIGIIAVVLPIVYLGAGWSKNRESSYSLMPMMVYLLVSGILNIINGLGYTWERFFGSAYVHVNNDQIAVKTGVWKKVQQFQWDKIKSLTYKTNWFEICSTDGSKSKLILSELEFSTLIETRDAIIFFASEKGLSSN